MHCLYQSAKGLKAQHPFVCLPTNSFALPFSMASFGESVRSLVFHPSKPPQDPFLWGHVEEIGLTVTGRLRSDANVLGFLFQLCCVLHTECLAQHRVCVPHAKLLTHHSNLALSPLTCSTELWLLCPGTPCQAQLVCLSSDWQTGSASSRDAAVALQQEKCCGAGLNPWAGPSGRGALPAGQTQPCAAFLSPCTQPDRVS